jgi:hypothetical protein
MWAAAKRSRFRSTVTLNVSAMPESYPSEREGPPGGRFACRDSCIWAQSACAFRAREFGSVPLIVVTSIQPGEGKTGVAAAIARHYAYLGRPVRVVRAGGEAGRVAEDAAWFGGLNFAPGSPTQPLAGALSDPGGDTLLVAEAGAAAAAAMPGAKIVLVAKGAAPATLPSGTTAVVVTRVSATNLSAIPGSVAGVPVVALAEDRTLAGFSISEAKALLDAETLLAGDGRDPTCDHLVISPISSDAGQPHFRRFPAKAVVVRFDRTDQHLAALRGDPECLILTGGRMPSSNALDAAGSQGVPVLLSRADTASTVKTLETLHDNPRFRGERKLDRMAELLEPSNLWEALGL